MRTNIGVCVLRARVCLLHRFLLRALRDEEHVPEKILNDRGRHPNRELLIKWKGWGTNPLDLTWQFEVALIEDGNADLVEAWYNQTTRRWEPPRPPMYKDPLPRNLIHLKPPHMVHKPGSPGGAQQRRESTRTLDGLTPEQAWRARQQGTR